jgi:hypothetical protein
MLRRYFQITAENGPEIQERVVNHVLELSNMLKDTIPPILSLLGAFPEKTIQRHPASTTGLHNIKIYSIWSIDSAQWTLNSAVAVRLTRQSEYLSVRVRGSRCSSF